MPPKNLRAPKKTAARSTRATKSIGDIQHATGEPISSPELRLTIYVVLLARRWRSLLDERLRPLGQSAARMEAMSAIYRARPMSTQVEIARLISIEGATFTRMLDTLEADGLVERLAYPSDRRSKQIRLTAAGERALKDILAVAADLRAWLLEEVSAEDIDTTNDFLRTLLERFDDSPPLRD